MKSRRDLTNWQSLACLSVNETAMVTGLSPATIHRLIRGRQLPSSKIGGRILIFPHEIVRFLEENAHETP